MVGKLKRGIRWLLPRDVTCRIYRWQAKRYVDNLVFNVDPQKQTLLALNHFYRADLQALANANNLYNLVVVDAPILFKGAKIHFSQPVIGIQAPYDSEPQENRMRYREECRLIFNRLQQRFHPDLIVTANDNFYWVREFILVAREYGVPTVILDKEGTSSPHAFEAEARRARELTPCTSDHVFVWSERQKTYWQKRDVEADRITVIGQPRSDLFYTEKRHDIDELFLSVKPLVTFFSYHDDAYIPEDLALKEGLNWCGMKTETHDEVYRLAQEHKDYNFVVKTHPQQPDLADLQSRYRLDNLRVIGGSALANELIQRSELIIAFQTTAVIEAMFLNKPVIYTYWDALLPRLQEDLLPFHRAKGILVARSLEEFHQICTRFLDGDRNVFGFSEDELKARERFVNEYLYRPDGHVCERFYSSIEQLVK